jgi:hypothetical protein
MPLSTQIWGSLGRLLMALAGLRRLATEITAKATRDMAGGGVLAKEGETLFIY